MLVCHLATLLLIQHTLIDRPEERCLNARIDHVPDDAEGRLLVADIAVKRRSSRVVAVYVSNDQKEG